MGPQAQAAVESNQRACHLSGGAPRHSAANKRCRASARSHLARNTLESVTRRAPTLPVFRRKRCATSFVAAMVVQAKHEIDTLREATKEMLRDRMVQVNVRLKKIQLPRLLAELAANATAPL